MMPKLNELGFRIQQTQDQINKYQSSIDFNNSQMDGFSIMKKIHDEQPDVLNKTIILTGNNKIEEKLQEQDVDFQKIKIVYKPASYKTIASVIKEKTG